MERIMDTHSTNDDQNKYFRFQVFQGDLDQSGRLVKNKSVGMAYLKSGQNIYTLRLWTFSAERFYVLPSKNDPTKYLVMTREPNKNPAAKNRYFWNIVGSGVADSIQGAIKIEFDLLSKFIYMGIHPESSAISSNLPDPETLEEAA